MSKVFSTFDQIGELAGNRLTSFSSGLREATQKATGTSVDVLRVAIVAVEESIAKDLLLLLFILMGLPRICFLQRSGVH